MRFAANLILIASIFFITSSSHAQVYPFVNYTPTDGLVNNRCRFMYQDSMGRLFIGTFGGLSIYDGARFTNYTTDNGLDVGLINDVVEMGEDSIWIIPNSNKIHCLVNGKLKDVITADNYFPTVNKLIKCSDGFYYALADDGLFRLKNNRFSKIHLKDRKGVEINNSFVRGTEINGKLFILTDPTVSVTASARLIIFDLQSGETVISEKPPEIHFVIQSPQNEILICTNEGIRTLDQMALVRGSIRLMPPPERYSAAEKITPSHVYFDRQQNGWLSTGQGVFKVDREGRLELFNVQNGLPVNQIACVYQDKENILWFLNTERGMSKLSSPGFESYSQIKPGFVPSDVYADSQTGSLWFLDNVQNKVLVKSNDRWQQTSVQNNSGSPYLRIVAIRGKCYLSSGDNLYQFDFRISGQPIIPNLTCSLSKADGGMSYMRPDKKGNLVFASTNIHALLDNKKMVSYPIGSLVDQFVLSEDNYLYVITRNKKLFLFRIHPEDPDHYFELLMMYSKELPYFGPRSIAIDKEGPVWVGSRDHGLFRFRFDETWKLISWENLTAKDGLSDNFISYLHYDQQGIIWAGTSAGLDKVQLKDKKIVVENITRANNLYQFVRKIETTNDGIHWILTNTGMIRIEPTPALIKNFQPNLFFSEIRAGQDTIETRAAKVSLSYEKNDVSIRLAAPSFINEKQTLFSYRLDETTIGTWTEPSLSSEIKFVNLAPGSYKLNVRAIFPSGLYPSAENQFRFEILPLWWQTWWFRILLILVAVIITGTFVRIYFRRKIEKQRMLLEKQHVIELERRRIAGEMHDDMGAGLSNIRFLSEKVKRESINTGTQTDAEKIVNNSNDLAQKMNEIIWAMNEQNDTLEALVIYTRAYAMEYCEENNLACDVIIPGSIPEKFVSGEIRRNIFLTVKESLHNVVKHSGAATVILEFKLDKYLSIRISDNGKGIDNQSPRLGGNGLINMQRRIDLLNGNIDIKSNAGVTVVFSIPLDPR